MKLLATTAIFLSLLANSALANISVRGGFSGSYFLAYASNSDDNGHNCNWSLSFDYDDFGEQKTYSSNGVFFVRPNQQDQEVLRVAGAYVNPRNPKFSYSCS